MFYLENILERATRLKERYFPSDLFYTGVSRPFFNLPPRSLAPRRQSVISSLSIEEERFFLEIGSRVFLLLLFFRLD